MPRLMPHACYTLKKQRPLGSPLPMCHATRPVRPRYDCVVATHSSKILHLISSFASEFSYSSSFSSFVYTIVCTSGRICQRGSPPPPPPPPPPTTTRTDALIVVVFVIANGPRYSAAELEFPGSDLAAGESTVILLHPPLPSVGVSTRMGRERQQNDTLSPMGSPTHQSCTTRSGSAGTPPAAAARPCRQAPSSPLRR